MITYILSLVKDIDKNKIITLFKEKYRNSKHDAKNKSYETSTSDYRIVYFYDEAIIMIIPKKIAKSIIGPDEFIQILRTEKFVLSAKAIYSVTMESELFEIILKNYETSLEMLSNEDGESVLITKEVEGIDYLIQFQVKDEKFNILVTDIDNNKKYIDLLYAIINAVANNV